MGPANQHLALTFLVLLAGCPAGLPKAPQPDPDGGASWTWPDLLAPDTAPVSIADLALRPDNGLDGGAAPDQGACTPGATEACYTGSAATRSVGLCMDGQRTCAASGTRWGACVGEVLPTTETCNDGVDNDCDGEVDETCSKTVTVTVSGDCVSVSCPSSAPYPVGCNITMGGGDCRGCVAHASGSSTVFFKEGDQCGGSPVQGELICSSVKGNALDASNCDFNKQKKLYVTSSGDCPTTSGGCDEGCSTVGCGSTGPVPGSDPECYCDNDCKLYGDCCSDYDDVCWP